MIGIERLKKSDFKYYLASSFILLTVFFLILEAVMRVVTFSTGAAVGSASKRWSSENWKPINRGGFRDFGAESRRGLRPIVFLGDSFTAGHGVRFNETYYFATREALGGQYDFFNVGENGSSTQKQFQNYAALVVAENLQPRYLVHQYFGNDIEDYVERVQIQRGFLRRTASAFSDAFNFLDTYLFTADFNKRYMYSLENAYKSSEILAKHREDLLRLHSYARSSGANVIFLVFPFLNSNDALKRSTVYVDPMRDYFNASCLSGDFFVDATKFAEKLSQGERVVNFLDAHPSPVLHQEIGKALVGLLINGAPRVAIYGVVPCRNG